MRYSRKTAPPRAPARRHDRILRRPGGFGRHQVPRRRPHRGLRHVHLGLADGRHLPGRGLHVDRPGRLLQGSHRRRPAEGLVPRRAAPARGPDPPHHGVRRPVQARLDGRHRLRLRRSEQPRPGDRRGPRRQALQGPLPRLQRQAQRVARPEPGQGAGEDVRRRDSLPGRQVDHVHAELPEHGHPRQPDLPRVRHRRTHPAAGDQEQPHASSGTTTSARSPSRAAGRRTPRSRARQRARSRSTASSSWTRRATRGRSTSASSRATRRRTSRSSACAGA